MPPHQESEKSGHSLIAFENAIEEFNIQKSIYPPEFGGKASATISAVTKSGGNTLHGNLYEFVRNDVFDARNAFDPARIPPYRQNQFWCHWRRADSQRSHVRVPKL
jgi:hypothetical protein